jgi:hypothetical protein
MLLAIFGAGASKDSVPPPELNGLPAEWRPPVTDELFGPRDSFRSIAFRWPDATRLVQRLRRLSPGVTVEQRLEELYDNADADEELDREVTALRFYMQEVLWRCSDEWSSAARGISNYGELVARAGEWRRRGAFEGTAFVTFNYDTLLDAVVLPRQLRTLDDYTSNPMATLFKVHGSVNWGRRLASKTRYGGDTRSATIAEWRQWSLSDSWEIIPSLDNSIDLWPLMPQLAIPMQTKIEFVCPMSMLNKLREALPKTSRVLIVGWKAGDLPFVNLLAEHVRPRTRVHVVSGGDPGSIARRLRGNGLDGDFRVFPGGFTKYLEDPTAFDRLAQA